MVSFLLNTHNYESHERADKMVDVLWMMEES